MRKQFDEKANCYRNITKANILLLFSQRWLYSFTTSRFPIVYVTLRGWYARQTIPLSVFARNQTKACARDLRQDWKWRRKDQLTKEPRKGQLAKEPREAQLAKRDAERQSRTDSRRDQSRCDSSPEWTTVSRRRQWGRRSKMSWHS